MEIKVKSNIGGIEYEFTIDENKELEALHKAIVLGSPKLYCNECKNSGAMNFRMDSNKDKDANIYVSVVCKKCGAKSKLGQYKSGGYFWHNFEKWQSNDEKKELAPVPNKEKNNSNTTWVKPDTRTDTNNDDLPF